MAVTGTTASTARAAAPFVERRKKPRVGWQRLPRDSRDTLFMLFVIGWTVLPHVAHLPLWCSLLTLVVLLWRAKLALANATLPSRWFVAGVLVVAMALTLWSFQTLLGKEPGVTMVVVLMALKTLELRAKRDAFVVFFLGFFIVLTHFLYSQSLFVAGAMLVSVWGLLTALVLVHMPVGQPSLKQASALSLRTALLGAPIMALMFLLFPRIGPLWGVPTDGLAKTGLSSTMRMGVISEMAQDDTVAMRIRFEGEPPPPNAMYFRGPVLTRFDGMEWRASTYESLRALRTPSNLAVRGAPVRYEVTMEALRMASLPLLDATPQAPAVDGYQLLMLPDLQWMLDRQLVERVRFKAESYPQFSHGPTNADAPALQESLDLPEGYNPRTLAWARELRHSAAYASAGPRALASAVLAHIRTGGYSYTGAPGEYGANAVDEFWLDRREGFCEHFASAFVVIMRAMNVPARIVTGYQGTDPLPLDDYYIVRQSSAHAWAEYWDPNAGWIRADPTAAVAPDRINRGNRLPPRPSFVDGALGNVNPALIADLRKGWELINNRWNQWVLNYSRGQQIDVLKRMGFDSPNWTDLALLLIGSLSTLALGGAAWAWWDRRRVDPWVRQMEHLRAALHELGLASAAHDAPRALAHRVRARYGAAADALVAMLETLERQRYSRSPQPRPDPALTRAFLAQARALRPAR